MPMTMRDNLKDFQDWVESLEWRDLQNAMEFSLPHSSHEADLLLEMVRLQACLPTPIHPRALGYRPRQACGVDDGRNEVERVQRDRFRRPRLFQWIEQRSLKGVRRFHVIARKFVSPDGTRLSTGSTEEQRKADEELVRATVVVSAPDASIRAVRFVNTGHYTKHRILRLLKVASRGNFLGMDAFSGSNSVPFTASWFDPTQRWFSLAMYLASRLEVALWSSYRDNRRTVSLLASNRWIGDSLEPGRIRMAINKAVAEAVKESVLMADRDSQLDYVRDSQLWHLLEDGWPWWIQPKSTASCQQILDGLLLCHVSQVGSAADQLRSAVCQKLLVNLSLYMEAELLSDLALTDDQPLPKRKKKPKKKKSKTSKPESVVPQIPGAESSDEEVMEADAPARNLFSFPDTGISARERNRNVVLALSIFEDVLQEVFVQVGLEESPSFEDDQEDKTPLEAATDYTPNEVVDEPVRSPQHKKPPVDGIVQLHASSGESPSLEVVGVLPALYETHDGEFYPKSEPGGYVWDLNDPPLDDWGRIQGFPNREQSLLTAFFRSQVTDAEIDTAAVLMASSTAASIDSASDKGESVVDVKIGDEAILEVDDQDESESVAVDIEVKNDVSLVESVVGDELVHESCLGTSDGPSRPPSDLAENDAIALPSPPRSLSPEAPATPSPTLSPILVTLADLKDMKKDVLQRRSPNGLLTLPSVRSLSSVTATSLPSSPYARRSKMVSSLSREDLSGLDEAEQEAGRAARRRSPRHSIGYASLRAAKSTDDHDVHRRLTPRKSTDALSSYRNTLIKQTKSKDDQDIRHSRTGTGPRDPPAHKFHGARIPSIKPSTSDSSPTHSNPFHFESPFRAGKRDVCAQSETAVDEYQWHEHKNSPDEADNNTVTKDGSTTITSALSQRESEELSAIREERNTYRDMCLTLGAEVAKLKTLLAAQRGITVAPASGFANEIAHHQGGHFFDPEAVFHPFATGSRAMTMAAMSDAGYRGEHESLASEDDTGARLLKGESTSNAILGSDASVDLASSYNVVLPRTVPTAKEVHDPVTLHGMQSRLAREIFHFIDVTNTQLKKQDPKRRTAVERMTRLVNTVWPRAQVTLYGSHVTGLCLPSSDLDFVIRLPAVHKKAVAVAPGALEGRNAINETSQKQLARKLKGESWVDPRSIKLIERTVVPVIKVSTKDTKARMLQLDITFDGPGHHGLEAVRMVSQICDELPMIRPLVLILKQFLLERGLLTAYTGGLSSYCLFLLVARYLQEQPSAWGDCGSLLMGFLDFYGNHFDARTTGISVRRREYFPRPTFGATRAAAPLQNPPPTSSWKPPPYTGPATPLGSTNFYRRNSFNDRGNVDAFRGGPTGPGRPVVFPAATIPPQQFVASDGGEQSAIDHRIPYTFDPLWVEDPLSEGNNVGRNAFRHLQVLRAFSDAHRALVAALEWDMQSTGELQDNQYPLLKSLLQSEDVVFDL